MSNRFLDLRRSLVRRRHVSNLSVVLLQKLFPTEKYCFLWPRDDPTFLEEEAELDTLLNERGVNVLDIEEEKMKEDFWVAAATESFGVATPIGETPLQERIRNRNSGQLFVSSDYPSRITDPKARTQLLLLTEVKGTCDGTSDGTNPQRQPTESSHRVNPTSHWIRQILCVCEDIEKHRLEAKLQTEEDSGEEILCDIKRIGESRVDVLQVPPAVVSSTSIAAVHDQVGVQLRFSRLLPRVDTPRETSKGSSHTSWEVPVVLRVLVQSTIVHAAYYQPCPGKEVPVSLKLEENGAQRIREAYVSYRDTVARHETRFLSALRGLVGVLLQAYSEGLPGGSSSDLARHGTIPQTVSLQVPVYHVRVAAADTAETRLSQLRPLCDTVISHCIDPSSSLMWESTCVLMVLRDISVITEVLLTVTSAIDGAEINREEKVNHASKDSMFCISTVSRTASVMGVVRLLMELDAFTAQCIEHRHNKPSSEALNDIVSGDRLTKEGSNSKLRIKQLSQALWKFYKDACASLFSHPKTAPLMHEQALLYSASTALPGPFIGICNKYLHQSGSTEMGGADTCIDVCESSVGTESPLPGVLLKTRRSFIDHYATLLRHLLPPPSILVHCRQGVSRSPSVASMYFISHMKHALREKQCNDQKEDPDVAVGKGSDREERNRSLKSFPQFMNMLREARPDINPNISFCAQLASFFRHILEN